MGKIEAKVEYPCGYKLEIKISALFKIPYVTGLGEECPLHGKDCVRKIKFKLKRGKE